jgi:hypothetical protein
MHLTRQEPVYWLRRMGSDMLSGLPAPHHMPKRKACPQPIRIEVWSPVVVLVHERAMCFSEIIDARGGSRTW